MPDPAALVAAVIVGASAWLLLRKKSRKPPGVLEAPKPPGNSILGHIALLGNKHFHRQFCKWSDEYGAVYQLNIGGPMFVVADASLAAPLLSRGPDYLPKAAKVYGQSYWLSFHTHSIFNESDDTDPAWQRVRSTLMPCFSTKNNKKMFPHMLTHADKMMGMWSNLLSAAGPSGEVAVEIDIWVQRCVMDSIAKAGFGYDAKALDGDYEMLHIIHDMLHEFSMRVANPLRHITQRLLPFLPSSRKLRKDYKRYLQLFENIMAVIESHGPPAPEDQTIGAALARLLQPSGSSPALPRNKVLGDVATLFVAGYDTSSSAISWALYSLALRPEIQKRCIAELAAAGLLHVAGRPAPGPITWENHASMPYVNAVIRESLRYSTTAATGTVREATRDLVLGKYWVPKGSLIWIPFAAIHESTVNFTDPREFLPERWLSDPSALASTTSETREKEEETAHEVDDKQPAVESRATLTGNAANISKSFLAFSTGPRDCMGQALAMVTLRTMIISVLSRFQLSVHPDTGTQEEVEANQVLATVMVPGNPVKLIIRPHLPSDIAKATA